MPRSTSQRISWGTSSAAAGTLGLEIIPTVLMTGIQEKFLIAFRARNRTFHDAGFEAQASHGALYAHARLAMQFRRAHNPAFADLAFPHFKLWLDEYNHATVGAQNGRGRR